MEPQLLALMAQTVIMAVLALVAVRFWLRPADINEIERDIADSDAIHQRLNNEEENSKKAEESVDSGQYLEEEIDESEDGGSDFVSFRPTEGQSKYYMEEMREMIGERRNNKEMEDMNRRLEMELENEREMEHLRELTTDSEREITVICKAAQDQWFGLIEACKHSVYVNNLNVRTSRKELEDHFSSCGTITTIEFCKDTINCRFIGMNSARVEFIDIPAKLKAMDLAGTLLKGSKIDVTTVPAPGLARYRSRYSRYRRFNYRRRY